jgi:hypothetical protein
VHEIVDPPSKHKTRKTVGERQSNLRFKWHELVIADTALTAGALRFAGLVMHRFRDDLGYAALSHREAAKKLGVSESTILNARDLLLELGWLRRLNPEPEPGSSNATARYALGNGPNDLDLALHALTGDSTPLPSPVTAGCSRG